MAEDQYRGVRPGCVRREVSQAVGPVCRVRQSPLSENQDRVQYTQKQVKERRVAASSLLRLSSWGLTATKTAAILEPFRRTTIYHTRRECVQARTDGSDKVAGGDDHQTLMQEAGGQKCLTPKKPSTNQSKSRGAGKRSNARMV